MTNYDDIALASEQAGITGDTHSGAWTKVEAKAAIPPKTGCGPGGLDGLTLWLSAGIDTFHAYSSEHKAELLRFEDIWSTMDQVSPLVMAQTLWELGWLRAKGEIITPDRIVATSSLDNKYRPLLSQWLEVLADHSILEPEPFPATYY